MSSRVNALARNGWWIVGEPLLCGVLPVVFSTLVYVAASRHNDLAFDFHHHFWPAAHEVLHGISPFPSPHEKISLGSFPYPPFAAVVLVPLALVRREIADPVFVVVLTAALFASLRVLRVRDWRCYGIVLLWAPVYHALYTANFTILLALGLAILWRVRHRSLAAGAVLGTLIALKVFLWPLLIWFVAAKRYRAAAWSLVFAAVITVAAWGTIGFAGLTDYPRLVMAFDRIAAPATYTFVGFGMKLGLGQAAAEGVASVIGLGVLALAVVCTRREGLGSRSFAAAIFAAILLSPIVWLHYFTLLVVPLAIFRPRLGPLWFLPLLAWPFPVGPAGPSLLVLPLMTGSALLLLMAARARQIRSDDLLASPRASSSGLARVAAVSNG